MRRRALLALGAGLLTACQTSVPGAGGEPPPHPVACTPAAAPVIGAVEFHLLGSDFDCVGSVSWPVLPNPDAVLTLNQGWCGDPACEAAIKTMRGLPAAPGTATFGRGYHLTLHSEGLTGPATLIGPEGQATVTIKSAFRE